MSGSASLESFEFREFCRFRVEAPEGVTTEEEGGGYVEQIVGAEAVTCGISHGKLLELPLQFRQGNHCLAKKLRFLDVVAEIGMRESCLLCRDCRLTLVACLKDV